MLQNPRVGSELGRNRRFSYQAQKVNPDADARHGQSAPYGAAAQFGATIMSERKATQTEHGGGPGHRRLADGILDAPDQAERQGRTEIAEQLRRVHAMLVEQEANQYEHRRTVD